MPENDSSKEELIAEVESLREEVARLKESEKEHSRMEEQILELEERYHSLFEESTDAIYVTTKDGMVVDANWSTLELFGYTKEEITGLDLKGFFVEPNDPGIIDEEIARNGFVMNYEVPLRKKDGTEIDCLLTTKARLGEKGVIAGYQGVIREITDQKRARGLLWEEQERRKIVVLNTCHLLHTPLTVIRGYLEIVKNSSRTMSPALIDKLIQKLDGMRGLIAGELYKNIDQMSVETSDGLTPLQK